MGVISWLFVMLPVLVGVLLLSVLAGVAMFGRRSVLLGCAGVLAVGLFAVGLGAAVLWFSMARHVDSQEAVATSYMEGVSIQAYEEAVESYPRGVESSRNPVVAMRPIAEAPLDAESERSSVELEGAEEAAVGGASSLEEPIEEHSVYIPPGRPDWVEANPVREGRLHSTAVASGLFHRKTEARRELDRQVKSATDEYINWCLEEKNAAAWLRYRLRDVQTKLMKPDKRYDEVIHVSFGPMHQAHALLEFDAAFRDDLNVRWTRLRATSRLFMVFLSALFVLCLLGVCFTYFRWDTVSRGYYTRRLQFGAAAAILILIAVGVLLANKIPWI